MDWFAELCLWIKAQGIGQSVYMSFHYLSVVLGLVYFLWIAKKYDVSGKRAAVALVVDSIIIYGLMLLIGWVESDFVFTGKRNFVTIYIWGPVVFWIGAKISGVTWEKLCVMHAPEAVLVHAVSRPGCMIVGCCKGFESSFGIYNIKTESYLFPIQAVEMVLALILVAVLIYILKRNRYQVVRWLYPFMLLAYGIIQFVCDFYRDNDKVWLGLSQRGYHALSMIVAGGVWLMILYCRWSKEQERKNRFKKVRS